MKSAILTIHEHRPSMDTKYEDMIQSVKRGIATTDESYNSQTYSFHHRPYHSKPYCFWVRRRMTDVESIGWKQNNERRKKMRFARIIHVLAWNTWKTHRFFGIFPTLYAWLVQLTSAGWFKCQKQRRWWWWFRSCHDDVKCCAFEKCADMFQSFVLWWRWQRQTKHNKNIYLNWKHSRRRVRQEMILFFCFFFQFFMYASCVSVCNVLVNPFEKL